MEENWTDVAEAVENASLAYSDLLSIRGDVRSDSKKVAEAQTRWEDAAAARAETLRAHWKPEDGKLGNQPSLGPVLRRYYAAKAASKGAKR